MTSRFSMRSDTSSAITFVPSWGHFSGCALFYSSFAALVLAVRTSHGERTERTIVILGLTARFHASRGNCSYRGAVATLAIPIVIAAGLLSIALASGLVEQAEPRHMAQRLHADCRNGMPRYCPRPLNNSGASRRLRPWAALSCCCS